MSEQPKKPSDNRTAAQRLTDLESAVKSLFNVSDNVVKDVMLLKDAIKLLDNKVNSIVKAVNAGEPLTDAVLTRFMTENNVAELAQRVANMASQGFIVPEEQVSENSFVVGTELDDEGNVINPRLQFALKALSPELQDKIRGSRPGDVLTVQEGKLKFKVLESYLIQEPKLAQPVAALEAEALAEAPAATPAPEASATPESAPTTAQATEAAAPTETTAAPESAPSDPSLAAAVNS